MNAITITPSALHAALTEVEAIGRIQGTAAYAGGIAALRGLFGHSSASPTASIAEQVRRAFDAETVEAPRADPSAARGILRSTGLVTTFYPSPAAQEEAQPTHTDSLPSIDPPIAIPPVPTGLGAAPPGARDTPAACSAIPAPSPPSVLAAEGTPAAPEASHAPPGDASPAPGPRQTIFDRLTQPQRDLLVTLWPDRTVPLSKILARVNALDGATLRSDAVLYNIMPKLGMPARGVLWLQQDQAPDAASIEARLAPESAGPEPDLLPPPAAPPAAAEPPPEAPVAPALSFPEDPQGREVWEAFDSGMSVRDVGADFGITLSTLTNTHAQWQLARRKELSA